MMHLLTKDHDVVVVVVVVVVDGLWPKVSLGWDFPQERVGEGGIEWQVSSDNTKDHHRQQ